MTKRWSSTRSDLTRTKREASKERRREVYTQEEMDEADREAEELWKALHDK